MYNILKFSPNTKAKDCAMATPRKVSTQGLELQDPFQSDTDKTNL